jgi:hypothetical protein
MTRFQQSLLPEVQTFNEDLDISQLFSLLRKSPVSGDSNSLNVSFSINRMHKCCFTPVRNPDVEKAVIFFHHRMYQWLNNLERYFSEKVTAAISRPFVFNVEEISKAAREVFIPLVPLFVVPPEASTVAMVEDTLGESTAVTSTQVAAGPAVGPNLAAEDISLLLQEHQRSLTNQLVSLQKIFPPLNEPKNNLFSVAEAQLSLLCAHLKLSIAAYIKLIRFVEDLIRSQLIRALGREVSPVDFQLYMSFHYRKLYRPEYQPIPFSYAVRRSPLHSPEVRCSLTSL